MARLRLIADSHPIPNTTRLLSPHLSPSNKIGIIMPPSHPIPSRPIPSRPAPSYISSNPCLLVPLPCLCVLYRLPLQPGGIVTLDSTRLDSTSLHSTPTTPYIHINTPSPSSFGYSGLFFITFSLPIQLFFVRPCVVGVFFFVRTRALLIRCDFCECLGEGIGLKRVVYVF